jgi:large subunit ribosomal protein L6
MENAPTKSKKIPKAEVALSQGVSAQFDGSNITINGPKGQISMRSNDKGVSISIDSDAIRIVGIASNKRIKTVVNTYKAHLKNMVKGVQTPYVYKLKVCSGHFPMTVTLEKGVIVIKNFLGEKVPRTYKVKEGVIVKVEGEIVTVESPSKDLAGMTAGAIEQLTRRPGFDLRIFQDGIYIIEVEGLPLK